MRCPVEVQLEPEDSPVLGLCGPSELNDLPRRRLALPQARSLPLLAPDLPTTNSEEVEAVLRRKLRCINKTACNTLLAPRVGRQDLAQHILSFVEAERPLMETEVGGSMFQDTGSANLDLFFQSVPQAKPEQNTRLHALLEKAWRESPKVCLAQVFLLGSRNGKQDRYSFYDAMMWLWRKDPVTLLANLHLIPECNYWKGLLEVLARVCEGPQRSLQRDLALHAHHKRPKQTPESHKCPWLQGIHGFGPYLNLSSVGCKGIR